MSTNTALDQITKRVEGLSDLCPEYMHLAIRNSVRNCDFDCQAHGEEEDCGPGQSDGARIAHSLADVPKLLAALEAVEALVGETASAYRKTADRLNQQVLDRDPNRDVETAAMYSSYARAWEAAELAVHRAITEALR